MVAKPSIPALLLAGMAFAAPAVPRAAEPPKPDWLRVERHRVLDGRTDDLVTGGLGVERLISGPAPGYADPGFGFGRLWGPNVDAATGAALPDGGRVASEEWLAYADEGDGRPAAAMLLQVPAGFGRERPCILAVPVNGSSSLYRDVVDFGHWGLRRGCAVVYTDKGAGNGVHDLASGTVNLIDGTTATAAEAGRDAHFAAPLDAAARARFLLDAPNRLAFKHAHSRRNAESGWGRDALRSIRFAVWQLNARAGEADRYSRQNTLVILAGYSNGGGAALYGAEQDTERLVDGVVVMAPQVQTRPEPRAVVAYEGRERRDRGAGAA